jgi:hypothetical protein
MTIIGFVPIVISILTVFGLLGGALVFVSRLFVKLDKLLTLPEKVDTLTATLEAHLAEHGVESPRRSLRR